RSQLYVFRYAGRVQLLYISAHVFLEPGRELTGTGQGQCPLLTDGTVIGIPIESELQFGSGAFRTFRRQVNIAQCQVRLGPVRVAIDNQVELIDRLVITLVGSQL